MKLGLHTISLWFGMLMVLVIATWAIVLTFSSFMDDVLYGNKRVLFIIVLFAYAIYRSFRIYQVLKHAKNEE